MSTMSEAITLHGSAVTEMICKAGGATVPEDTMPSLYNTDVNVELYRTFTHVASELIIGSITDTCRGAGRGESRGAEEPSSTTTPSSSPDSDHCPPWLSRVPGASSRHMVISITLTQPLGVIEAGETVWMGLLHDEGGILGLAIFW